MCSAGYAAARAGDHDRATDLLDEADNAAGRLADHPAQQQALAANVISQLAARTHALV